MLVYCKIDPSLIEQNLASFEEAKVLAKEKNGIIIKVARRYLSDEIYILDVYTTNCKVNKEDMSLPNNGNGLMHSFAVITDERVKSKIMDLLSDDWEVRKKYTKNTVIW